MSIEFKALEISANAQEPEGSEPIPKKVWAFTIVAALALAVGLFFLVPFGLTSLAKGWLGESSVLFYVLVEGVPAHRDLPGLPDRALAPARPAAPVPVPRRRAQGHLDLRGGPAADRRERPAVQPPAPPLRHQLPARGDDRGHLRLRPDRAARVVLLLASRLIGVPLVTGISFEVIKFAGRHRGKGWVQGIIWPGMQLQKLERFPSARRRPG